MTGYVNKENRKYKHETGSEQTEQETINQKARRIQPVKQNNLHFLSNFQTFCVYLTIINNNKHHLLANFYTHMMHLEEMLS